MCFPEAKDAYGLEKSILPVTKVSEAEQQSKQQQGHQRLFVTPS